MAAIDADFGISDLAPLAAAEGVSRAVVVETVSSEAETLDLLALAATDRLIAGVVGWVDLAADDVAARLAAMRRSPGGEALVGVRHQVQGEDDPGFLDRPEVRRGVAAVADAGLAFDVVIRHEQLPQVVRLAREVPQVRLVLDHLGKPDLAGGDLAAWRRDLSALAEAPNVVAKVSGLVTEARWDGWSTADLRPAVVHALDTFGPGRLVFGSDWPVVNLAGGYARWVLAYDELTAELTEDERAAIDRATAERVYRLAAGETA
ncbi:amidohydrolase 2 [Beutenbergia cavernae DSM 12333]|uniref:Amidohydrolase 2 n=2 Tax=Beutenbergia TaxID=84756 RepID=C5C1K4_BEUC1|nr:amidohydrolase 2 [Beutenbergia cavernae DSM 12333]